MNDNQKLINRALKGNEKAQEECTEKGIVLPCPFCGEEAQLISEKGLYTIVCKDGPCIGSDIHPEYGEAMFALEEWNTRPAPPVGRCRECKCWRRNGSDWGSCSKWYTEDKVQAFMLEDDFCSNFKPREESR